MSLCLALKPFSPKLNLWKCFLKSFRTLSGVTTSNLQWPFIQNHFKSWLLPKERAWECVIKSRSRFVSNPECGMVGGEVTEFWLSSYETGLKVKAASLWGYVHSFHCVIELKGPPPNISRDWDRSRKRSIIGHRNKQLSELCGICWFSHGQNHKCSCLSIQAVFLIAFWRCIYIKELFLEAEHNQKGCLNCLYLSKIFR